MPNITLTTYVSDDEYVKYIDKKKEINVKIKEVVKRELARKTEVE